MDTTKASRNPLKCNYYPNQVPWYPGKITSAKLLRGFAKKGDYSLSSAIDHVLNDYFSSLAQSERELLLFFADQEK